MIPERDLIVTHIYDGQEVVTDANQMWVATFYKPEDARLFMHADQLLSMLRRYSSECTECDGGGQVEYGHDMFTGCKWCADARNLIRRAEGAE